MPVSDATQVAAQWPAPSAATVQVAQWLWLALGVGVIVVVAASSYLKEQARSRSGVRVKRSQVRTLWFSLALWLAACAVALAAFRWNPYFGLAVAVVMGVPFGWVSARRVDAQRVKIRKRRRRRTETDEVDDDEGELVATEDEAPSAAAAPQGAFGPRRPEGDTAGDLPSTSQ